MRQRELDMMTSQQLDELLKAELDKECLDREKVLAVMRTLEAREAEESAASVDAQAVWEEFQKNREKAPARRSSYRWMGVAAAVFAVVLVFAMAAPPAMGFPNIFTLIGKWTKDVFSFFQPFEEAREQEYVFRTDHPGLQQVYEAVVELGVTEPVVPTWIPEGYELQSLRVIEMPTGPKLFAYMRNGDLEITIDISNVARLTSNDYLKDQKDVIEHEVSGVMHYLLQNEEKWVAAWLVEETVECSIVADCDMDTLVDIIDSVYEGE